MRRSRHARLTDYIVSQCKPSTKEYALLDSTIGNLSLRIRPSGAKTWTVRTPQAGRTRRITLGDPLLVTVSDARARAHMVLAGNVPVPSPPSATFIALERAYRVRSHWKPSSERTYMYCRQRFLRAFKNRKLATIRRADVARWFYDYSASYPGGSNRALSILRAMFNRAVDWGMLPTGHANPCTGLKRNRRPCRGRAINDDGLARLGDELRKLEETNPDLCDLIRLLLYTGCRPGEIMRLQWSEVHGDRLIFEDSKTGPRTCPIGDPAQKILATRRTLMRSIYVFPSPRDDCRPYNEGLARSHWPALQEAAGLDHSVRLYDLRHTFASHAVMSGESLMMTEALLGHRQLSTTAIYTHHFDDHLLAAAERISSRIATWLFDSSSISAT